MPNLALIQTNSLVPMVSTGGGEGLPAGREFLSAGEGLASAVGSALQQHNDEKAKVWAGSALSDFHLRQAQALKDGQDKAAADVAANGAVPDMTGEFLTGFDKNASDLMSTAPNATARRYLQAQLTQARSSLGQQAIAQQATLEKQWKLSTAQTTADNGGKIVQQDPSQFDAQMANIVATMPHIDPATDQAHLLRAQSELASAAASSTLDRDPYALKALTGKAMGEGGFSGPTGTGWVDKATPEQVKTWNTAADTKIRMIENANRLDADAREKNAQSVFNELQPFVAGGSVPDLAYTQRVQAATKGTSFEASANAALALAARGGGFGSATLPAQQARLEQMQTQQAGGTNPEDAALMKQLQTIHDTQTAAYKDDALEASNRFAHVPVQPTQQILTVQQGIQLAAARAPVMASVESASGSPASPLHPAEAQQLGKLLKAMQPDQAATAMSQLGATIGDANRIAAVSKQLGDTDGTIGLAMAYAGNTTNQGRLVGELILRGDQAMQDKRTEEQVQKQENWKATAATQIRGAFSDVTLETKVIDAAVKVNAGTALNGQDDMDAAVRMVTGGIIQHGAAGAKIPLPYGMTEDAFNKKLSALTPASFASQVPDGVVHIGTATMPLQQFVAGLKDATLVHAGQGQYNVRGGTTLATNALGQRIWIRP